ncbi:sensor histidine kinase [Pseudoduganella sp. GCM10020061]|uniref:sensor histidine kinase n=1 Tax=Pseudoduganella sp. GCM10020061 TaxID=3317345 RepID=UPI00363C8935
MSTSKKHGVQDLRDFLHEAMTELSVLWWRFFDWLAIAEWRQLYITWFLVFVFGVIVQMVEPAMMFIMITAALKIIAGGKRRAELVAKDAVEKADVANLERRLVEAQMATLQAQVEPHFLFNTLALIGQLIETDPPQAARIHQNLIEYLRATLPQMRATGGGTLGKQVELARAYLAIMQARMKERLAVTFDVPAHLETAPFPPMMLLTLIENAIKHGLEPKIEGGHIEVTARVVDRQLWVDVQDNGVGFNLHSDEGVGLANIRERLRLLFGDQAQLVIEAPLAGGAYASIRVPYGPMEKRP